MNRRGSAADDDQEDEDSYRDIVNPNENPLATIYTCGWIEDSRCGYDLSVDMQLCPRPVDLSTVIKGIAPFQEQYVCEAASCGKYINNVENIDVKEREAARNRHQYGARSRKLLCVVGLNQQGLCEEPGNPSAELGIIPWDVGLKDDAAAVCAGDGTSFVLTKRGRLYSFGNGLHGKLGHGDCVTIQSPRIIAALNKIVVTKVCAGERHTACISDRNKVFSWGHNNFGQLGIGSEGAYHHTPAEVTLRSGVTATDLSCGAEYTVCVVLTVNEVTGAALTELHGWGSGRRGQLGPDTLIRGWINAPEEIKPVTRLVKRERSRILAVAAGGEHCLLVLAPSGRVASWGAADYGQLGHGFVWDDAEPRLVNGLADVFSISAGKRHSMALVATPGEHKVTSVYSWGCNGYGELGVGDTHLRLQPSKLRGVIETIALRSVSCGARHSAIVASPVPKRVKEHPQLAPYFKIIEKDPESEPLQLLLRKNMKSKGLDPDMLDRGAAAMPDQAGSTLAQLKNDLFEQGLRYCLDTMSDPADWRRKAYETCFECPRFGLTSICLTCARLCKNKFALKARVRMRKKGDICDCHLSGICNSRFTVARAAFDSLCGEDQCIGPNQMRVLLQSLRAPLLVESADMEVCLIALAGDADEISELPRIKALEFETWYQNYFD